MVQLKVLFQVLPMVVQCWNMKHCTIYIATLHLLSKVMNYGPFVGYYNLTMSKFI